MEEKVKQLLETIESNMAKCNVGDVYGPLYEAGYRTGVSDVTGMIRELLSNKE